MSPSAGEIPVQSDVENVRVAVRCRPLSQLEQKQGHKVVVDVDETGGTVTVRSNTSSEPAKVFTYDCVFGPQSKQLDVYNAVARPIVNNVLLGYNGTIFAYGQTGTGKTFTMSGPSADSPTDAGIIPNTFAHIFGHLAKAATEDKCYLVRVSYLEIYNEEIRDLLSRSSAQTKLEIKERPDVGVYVKDLSSVTVANAEDMLKIMVLGNKNRATAATDMNAHSSRSHAIFTATVECSEKGMDGKRHFRVGKLHLVDLAGSERQSKTGATGDRLREAAKINLSLSTLGNVISALVDAKATHVPYRNSLLTRLLQDSLGGNSKTVMIANIGPAGYNADETVSTLRYASRAKHIQNAARINEDPKDALLRKYQQEIEQLTRMLEDGDEGSEGDEPEGSDEENPDQTDDAKRGGRRRRLNSTQLRAMEEEIEKNRKDLLERKDMAEGERRKLEAKLAESEAALKQARDDHESLVAKLQSLERRVIVGGENLLEKAEQQARLLEESNRELADRRAKEAELRRALQQKAAERVDIEERYSSLQEEAAGKTRKLKKVWTMLAGARAELTDLATEHQREMEGLLESVRELSKELRLQMVIIDTFIPPHYQDAIERYVHWNEEVGEWELKCIAYTGNNMRSTALPDDAADSDELAPLRAVGSAAADFSAAASPARPQRNKAAAARTQSERDHQSAFAPAPRQANSGRRQSGGQRQRQSPSVRQTATFAHRPPDRRKSQREDNHRKSTSNGSTLPGAGSSASGRKALQFKLEPEYFIVASRTAAGGPAGARGEEEVIYVTEDGAPVTAAQAARLKEQNQRRVKQLVAAVGITLTVLSVLLVAASLAFGNKIDKLGDEYKTEAEKWKPPWEIDVDSASRGSASELSGDRNSGFYLGRQPHWEPSTSSTVAPQSDGDSALKSSTPGAGANVKVDADDSGDGNHDASKVKLNSVGRVAQKKKWGKVGLGMNIR